jgi:hypothetical protein
MKDLEGICPQAFGYFAESALKVCSSLFPMFSCAPGYIVYEVIFFSRFTHYLLGNDWVFKVDFPYPLSITTF